MKNIHKAFQRTYIIIKEKEKEKKNYKFPLKGKPLRKVMRGKI